MKQICLDIETLSNKSNAAVTQIGALIFDETTGDVSDEFLVNIDIRSLDGYSFHVDYDTLGWWFNQSRDAQQSVYGDHLVKVNIKEALSSFSKWVVAQHEKYGKNLKVWSHSTFDPPILTNAYYLLGKRMPIRFIDFMDIRTLDFLTSYTTTIPRNGVHHNALDDCRYQAKYICKMMGKL